MPSDISVGSKIIGVDKPAFIIAELGYNFNTPEEALESVDVVAECGVDAIKIQTFKAETTTTRSVAFPAEAGGVNQFDEFKQYEISEELHQQIKSRAEERDLVFFSTPSYRDDVDLLERLNVEIHKIGSDDLTNLPFLEYVARTGKPLIFSSGMATLGEVDEAVRTLRGSGADQLILLQCVSNYPVTDVAQMNLRVIETFRRSFPVHVGLSDHTTGVTAAVAAVTLGACVVEKHFAISKQLPVPDAFFSADPAEMKELVEAVRDVESMLGDGFKAPASSESDMREDTRKSVIARRDLKAGEELLERDIIIKRPGHGVAPRLLALIIGRQLRQDVNEDCPVTWDAV